MFLQRVTELLDSRGITRNKLLTDIGLNKNSFVVWGQRGTVPGGDTLTKIADYFGVSTDYLLGRTDSKEPQGEEQQISDADIMAAFFRGADDMPEEEMEAMWADAKDYFQYKLDQRRRKKNGGAD